MAIGVEYVLDKLINNAPKEADQVQAKPQLMSFA